MQILRIVAAVAFHEIEDQVHLALAEGEEGGVASVELDVRGLVVELGQRSKNFFAIEFGALPFLARSGIVQVFARILFTVLGRFVKDADLHARN